VNAINAGDPTYSGLPTATGAASSASKKMQHFIYSKCSRSGNFTTKCVLHPYWTLREVEALCKVDSTCDEWLIVHVTYCPPLITNIVKWRGTLLLIAFLWCMSHGHIQSM